MTIRGYVPVKRSMRSSPWIRGAPQVGFSATIRKINSRTSFGVGLLPTCFGTLEISLQYIRKRVRCQRTTVSGVTTRRACFHPDQTRRAITQKSLSKGPKLGRGCRRFRESREGDFAVRERGEPVCRSRARRGETCSGFITKRRRDGTAMLLISRLAGVLANNNDLGSQLTCYRETGSSSDPGLSSDLC
jgi:hypothetical protein